MANIKIKQPGYRQFGGAAPYGNTASYNFPLATTAAGAVVNGDSTVAVAIGDVVDLGPLPAGLRLDDSFIAITTGMTASVTGSLGFRYEDGVDSTTVPQDNAYFGAGVALSTAGRLRNATSKAIVTLPKQARLILTTAGANNAKASALSVVVMGELTGTP